MNVRERLATLLPHAPDMRCLPHGTDRDMSKEELLAAIGMAKLTRFQERVVWGLYLDAPRVTTEMWTVRELLECPWATRWRQSLPKRSREKSLSTVAAVSFHEYGLHLGGTHVPRCETCKGEPKVGTYICADCEGYGYKTKEPGSRAYLANIPKQTWLNQGWDKITNKTLKLIIDNEMAALSKIARRFMVA